MNTVTKTKSITNTKLMVAVLVAFAAGGIAFAAAGVSSWTTVAAGKWNLVFDAKLTGAVAGKQSYQFTSVGKAITLNDLLNLITSGNSFKVVKTISNVNGGTESLECATVSLSDEFLRVFTCYASDRNGYYPKAQLNVATEPFWYILEPLEGISAQEVLQIKIYARP